MFCPNCGKGDQQPAGYCRQCGTLQPDPQHPFYFPHLSRSAVRTSTVANAAAALMAFIVAFVLYTVVLGIGGGSIVHLLAWASILVGLWCSFAAWKSFQLEKDFRNGSNESSEDNARLVSPITDKLLNEANFEQFVPPSVTDTTTKHLTAGAKRSSNP